jgi:hypothetical protein
LGVKTTNDPRKMMIINTTNMAAINLKEIRLSPPYKTRLAIAAATTEDKAIVLVHD